MNVVPTTTRVMLAVMLAVLISAAAAPQEKVDNPPTTNSRPKSEKKPTLVDAIRVSTAEATKSAVKEKSKQSAQPETMEESNDPAVLEFRPTANTEEGTVVAPSGDSKKLKNVHGKVYGAVDAGNSGNRQSGAAVGASSKSGKSSVYVETDRSRTTPPR